MYTQCHKEMQKSETNSVDADRDEAAAITSFIGSLEADTVPSLVSDDESDDADDYETPLTTLN